MFVVLESDESGHIKDQSVTVFGDKESAKQMRNAANALNAEDREDGPSGQYRAYWLYEIEEG